MSSRRGLAGLLVLALVIVGLYFISKKKDSAPESSVLAPQPVAPSAPSASPLVSPGARLATPASSAASSQANAHPQLQSKPPVTPPSLQTYREEVRKDPHSPPPSFLEFAHSVGVRMDAVKGSPVESKALFDELADCVSRDTVAPMVQAFCLSRAARLAKLRPELDSANQALWNSAPGNVRNLVEARPNE